MLYNRDKAIKYAHQWAHNRNPDYFNFDAVGGDCTSFISQCLYAGCGIMNYTRDLGWYYKSITDRAAAWSGVEYLHKFITTNKKAGPYASELPLNDVQAGDIIQLSFDGSVYAHSLFVVEIKPTILISAHTMDWDNRPLNTYKYKFARLLHIEGVRE